MARNDGRRDTRAEGTGGLTECAIDHIAAVTRGRPDAWLGTGRDQGENRPDVRYRGVTPETHTTAPAEPRRRDTRSAGCGL